MPGVRFCLHSDAVDPAPLTAGVGRAHDGYDRAIPNSKNATAADMALGLRFCHFRLRDWFWGLAWFLVDDHSHGVHYLWRMVSPHTYALSTVLTPTSFSFGRH